MDLNQNFVDLTDEELSSYMVEVRAAFDALAALDTPTEAQIAEAEQYADHLDEIIAESAAREDAAEALADRAAALKNRFAPKDEDEVEEEEPEDEVEVEEPEAEVVEGEVVEVVEERIPAAARSKVAVLARKTTRPKVQRPAFAPVTITAAADVPEFATGSKIETMSKVAQAMVNRMHGFGTPTGTGETESLQHYGVATFRPDYPKNLTIDRGTDDQEVMTFAASEHRLPGGSLVAAGGWCAPSETLYDLCPGGSMDGLLSIPEVAVSRGGIKYTKGPDFSALYSASFCQTEAQAIAGTTRCRARRSSRSALTPAASASRSRSSPTRPTRNSCRPRCPRRWWPSRTARTPR